MIIAYIYTDPLLETPENPLIWGLEVDRIYEDIGKREQLKQLIKDSQTNPPQYLLIRYLEELGNTLEEVNDNLKKIESLNIEVIAIYQSYNSSKFLNDDSDNNKDNLMEIIQQVHKNQQSRNLKRGHARNRLQSVPPPGRSPYGYRRGKDRYIIDRSTYPVIKDFFERFLLYGSLRDAVRYLERKYGKKIAISTGSRWLTNPVYRGNLAYKNNEIISDTHLPIISKEEAAQIDRLLRRNSILPPRSASASRSLAGLVSCQKCQSTMKITKVTKRNKKQEYLYLTPLNCTEKKRCKSINYYDVLDKTINNICSQLPEVVSQLNFPSPENLKRKLESQIQAKQTIVEQLPNLIQQGILDEETAQIRNYKLRTEIAEIKAKIAQLPPVNLQQTASTVSLPEFWLDLSETERRFYFREFIRQILIIPLQNEKKNTWEIKLIWIWL